MATSNDLNISEAGYVTFDGTATFHGRTFQAGTGITLTNASGVAGNTTITANGANDLHTAKFIVSSEGITGTGANFTSISAAIAAAQGTGLKSTIFIMPGLTGTYTENFTLPANINITAFDGDQSTDNVKIVGKITCSGAGISAISNISLNTNGDYLLVVSGNTNTQVYLNNCELIMTNGSGINFTSSSASAYVQLNKCYGTITAGGPTLYVKTSPGILDVNYCYINTSGAATIPSTSSAGDVTFKYCHMFLPVSYTSTATGGFDFCNFGSSDVVVLNLSNSAGVQANSSYFASGTATSITVSGGIVLYGCHIFTSNATAISGAGSLVCTPISFGNGRGISVGLLVKKPFGPPFYTYPDQGSSITLDEEVNNSYFITAATTQTLPASPAQGDVVKLICDTSGTVIIQANTGQSIRLGNVTSTVAGSATNTAQGDAIELSYRSTGLIWIAQSSVGNWTLA